MKQQELIVKGLHVSTYKEMDSDYISLTDIGRFKDKERSDYILQNWMRSRSTVEFMGLWEKFNNPNFNSIEFDGIKILTGLNSFSLTPKKWIALTNATGIVAKTGRYGGTFAHKDIAFEFASWLSIEFKFYLIREFQRLKDEEATRNNLTWNLQRTIAKINYKIHSDAIRENLIPSEITKEQASFIYASEADLLNVAIFGKTAKELRYLNSLSSKNIRDQATLEQLIVLSNLESINSLLLSQNLPSSERLIQLNKIAIFQMTSLLGSNLAKELG